MALSCTILEIKRDIGKKSWSFHTPFAFDAPVRGSQSDYCLPVWYGKTRMMGLPDSQQCLTIGLPVFTERTNVTDRQIYTHRWTPHDGKGRVWCKHRVAKMFWANVLLYNFTWLQLFNWLMAFNSKLHCRNVLLKFNKDSSVNIPLTLDQHHISNVAKWRQGLKAVTE